MGLNRVTSWFIGSRIWIGIGAGILLGVIFFISGLGKLVSHGAFSLVLSTESFLPSMLSQIVGVALPWAEYILGTLLVLGILAKVAASLSAVCTLGFISHNSWLLATGRASEDCGCFGLFEKFFLGKMSTIDSLSLDIIMLCLFVLIIVYYPGKFLNIRPWFSRK